MAPQYIGGRYYATMYGSDAPAPLWKMYMDATLANTPVTNFSPANTGPQPSAPGNGGSTNASDNSGSGAATEANASVESPAPSAQDPSVQEPPAAQAAPAQESPAPQPILAEQFSATEQTPRRTQETSQSLAPDDDETER